MKNGSAKKLTQKQHRQLLAERKKTGLQEMATSYGISKQCLYNILKTGKVSERVFNQMAG